MNSAMKNDTVYRKAVIDAMCNACSDWCDEGVCKKVSVIQQLPSAQQWIPVTEGLPKVKGCYLVSVKNEHERRYSKTAWFEKGSWLARQDVIAWIPLPESYEERQKND